MLDLHPYNQRGSPARKVYFLFPIFIPAGQKLLDASLLGVSLSFSHPYMCP